MPFVAGSAAWLFSRVRVLGLLGSVAACSADLADPAALSIACNQQADCPGRLRCAEALRLCVSGESPAAPSIASVSATYVTTLEVVFAHAMQGPSVADPGAFAIQPPLAVLEAEAQADGTTVTLITAPQAGGRAYTLTASGVLDAFGTEVEATSFDFVGFGPTADGAPPTLTSPPEATYLVGLTEVELAWAPRFGAHSYDVEVATSADFASPVASAQVIAPGTSTVLTLTPGHTYFWRVRADVTDIEALLPTSNFALLADTVHVACASGSSCAPDPSIARGGQATPLGSPQEGVDLALALGLEKVRLAGRGDGAAYAGGLFVFGGGVDIEGGYSPDFATHDPAVYPTRLESAGVTCILGGVRAPTRLAWLELVSTADSALSIGDAGEALTVEDCRLESAAGPSLAVAVTVADGPSPGPLLRRNTVEVVSGPDTSVGVLVGSGEARLVDNQVRSTGNGGFGGAMGIFLTGGAAALLDGNDVQVAGSTDAWVVRVDGADAVITHNQLASDATVSWVYGVDVSGAGSATVAHNSIHLHGARRDAVGISCGGASGYGYADTIIVDDNLITITGGHSGTGVHTDLLGGGVRTLARVTHNTVYCDATPDAYIQGCTGALITGDELVTNNIFACKGEVPRHGVRQVEPGFGGSLKNNLFAGCATVFSHDDTDYADVDALNLLDGETGSACETSRIEANLVFTLDQLFVDPDGADDDLGTAGDNDWRLLTSDPAVTQGGHDTSASDCGPCGATTSCGAVGEDVQGTPRTPPPSIGAFEKDT